MKKIGLANMRRLRDAMLRANNYHRFLMIQFLGMNMEFDLFNSTDVITLSEIRSCGLYEKPTSLLVMHRLRPGGIFVDVGANAGYYSLLASRGLAGRGKIYAFEPSTSPLERLRRNIEINELENVVIVPKAAWKEATRLPLFASDIQDGMNSLLPVSHSGVRVVDAVTLDSTIREERIDLVKIDVEGAEKEVVVGARNLLRSRKIGGVIVEWHGSVYTRLSELSCRLNYFRSIGNVYRISKDERDGAQGYALVGPIDDRRKLPVSCHLFVIPK